ncbi:FtsB family cell division protein [Desulfurivibrio alkaliphilus]|uniref:Septum formation initiator n=1 Tax=Desulfurivibrio alkaliphilus (strain DSM 19089 / UNIQEM U267 / AHT2) TaxID=589865 RepID=D6Z183_DESAT|nr:septum formation initiator family protein [Desulfurivibrio alkaliphilus]ADH85338.1 Septum formation initiator [Desulfurivibrio alkaliphilus AHT 2]
MVRAYQYKQKEKNPTRILALLLLAALALWLLASPYGLWQYGKVSRQLNELQQKNHSLEVQQRQLREEIDRLQHDPEYIEEVARREYGLLKENEILFDFSPRR